MTHPMPNTSSMGRSGCSQVDRFSKHFEKYRNREGHVKASVFLPTWLVTVEYIYAGFWEYVLIAKVYF